MSFSNCSMAFEKAKLRWLSNTILFELENSGKHSYKVLYFILKLPLENEQIHGSLSVYFNFLKKFGETIARASLPGVGAILFYRVVM